MQCCESAMLTMGNFTLAYLYLFTCTCAVEGLIGESWQKVFVELYKDGTFVWYKKKNDRNTKGSVCLKVSPTQCIY